MLLKCSALPDLLGWVTKLKQAWHSYTQSFSNQHGMIIIIINAVDISNQQNSKIDLAQFFYFVENKYLNLKKHNLVWQYCFFKAKSPNRKKCNVVKQYCFFETKSLNCKKRNLVWQYFFFETKSLTRKKRNLVWKYCFLWNLIPKSQKL